MVSAESIMFEVAVEIRVSVGDCLADVLTGAAASHRDHRRSQQVDSRRSTGGRQSSGDGMDTVDS